MRRTLAALAAAALLCLTGCAGSAASDRPLVVVTTNILGDVVSKLAGDDVEVLTLMRPGADPHSFEISAAEAARMRSADLLVANGLGLEEGLQQHLDAASADGVRTIVAGDAVRVLPYTSADADGADDPHFWTDPAQMIAVVDRLTPALESLGGAAVTERSAGYRAQLETLDADMTAAFSAIPAERRALVTNHHVFGYLADRFDFRLIGAVIPGGTTLAAPSTSDLADLVAAIDEAKVPTIFAESSSPDRLVRALAEEADRHVEVTELFTESLTDASGDAPDYLTMMRVNTERIATGLSP
ncbi:zinc ABC transporter substrate-binding protein AztC [Microbacterium sp. 20-116]|uniref:zinc ABC transporter substrate-binding protein AztC n=1 Tax=unclassified Microbacterium TaxID=2609290 RepID=UPI0022713069|nr:MULTISPECIES: zinc ABC transporter substrate-binding protein AztC [unclassified Microbacterium]MDQ1175654.1 zinc/manganese transport system substrate-binding protein [Microbacterium sp. SORGH_AS_0421]WAC69606.1 zinc ABC transporter substrate-binding protein AztC [Microbacterium sp. SL75]